MDADLHLPCVFAGWEGGDHLILHHSLVPGGREVCERAIHSQVHEVSRLEKGITLPLLVYVDWVILHARARSRCWSRFMRSTKLHYEGWDFLPACQQLQDMHRLSARL